MTITYKQYQHLQSFFMALSGYYIDGIPTNFGHWANLLDDLGIPWKAQNVVSMLAENKSNTGFYLTTLLAQYEITIK